MQVLLREPKQICRSDQLPFHFNIGPADIVNFKYYGLKSLRVETLHRLEGLVQRAQFCEGKAS